MSSDISNKTFTGEAGPLELRLLGGLSLHGPDGPVTGRAAQRRRLALLALLAGAPGGGLSRDKLVAYLWPENDTESARHLLSDSLYVLRRELGEDVVEAAGEDVRLNPSAIAVDVWELERALEAGEPERATELYPGPFLDGFFIDGAPEFGRWADEERRRLARRRANALETLAESADAAGDARGAVGWWRELAAADPANGRVTLRLMRALVAAGERAGALREAERHGAWLRDELGAEPEPEVETLADRLREEPTPGETAPAGRTPGIRADVVIPAGPGPNVAPRASRSVALEPGPRRRARIAVAAGVVLLISVAARSAWSPPSAGTTGTTPAVAVLPFTNLSSDPEDAYFSDGITEEITARLALFGGLRVVSHASSSSYEAAGLPLRRVARELGADYLVDGSVRRSGHRVRIVARLVDGRTDAHVWAETFERELADAFGVQTEVARRVARMLSAEISPREARRLERRRTENAAAYDLYLRGRDLVGEGPEENDVGIGLLRRAIALDPGFASAHATLARAIRLRSSTYGRPGAWGDSARVAAHEAIRLDPELPDGHLERGFTLLLLERPTDAERAFRRAVALNPNSSAAMHGLGNAESLRGRFDEALFWIREAFVREPTSAHLATDIGTFHWLLNRDEEAEPWFRRGRALSGGEEREFVGMLVYLALARGDDGLARARTDSLLRARPGDLTARLVAAECALWTGRIEEAAERFERLFVAAPDKRHGLGRSVRVYHAYTLLRTGERPRALALLDDALALDSAAAERGHGPNRPMEIAVIHAMRGDTTAAFRWLERAYETGWRELRLTARDPLLDHLAGHPRLQAWLGRIERDIQEMRRRTEVRDRIAARPGALVPASVTPR